LKVGDRIEKTKIIPVKWIPDNHDSDWDGVPNYRDCQPFNPNKQDDEKEKKSFAMLCFEKGYGAYKLSDIVNELEKDKQKRK